MTDNRVGGSSNGSLWEGIQNRVSTNINTAVKEVKEIFTGDRDVAPTRSNTNNVRAGLTQQAPQMSKEFRMPSPSGQKPAPRPVSAAAGAAASGGVTAASVLAELRGKRGDAFVSTFNAILQNPAKRAALISHYSLDSTQNKNDLGRAMILEAGSGNDRGQMEPVGRAILNRALAVNVTAEIFGRRGGRTTIANIMGESGQFSSYRDFRSGGGSNRLSNANVQASIDTLVRGSTGTPAQATAFFFRSDRHMSRESFFVADPSSRSGIRGHSFSEKSMGGVEYVRDYMGRVGVR